MRAYKVFNNDWTCNNFQYEVGKEYEYQGRISICESGFHACEKLEDCFTYYDCVQWNKIAEVELSGEIYSHDEDSKKCASKIKIVREIAFNEIADYISEGVATSQGVAWSQGVARSLGIRNCKGIFNSIFSCDIESPSYLFNKQVDQSRFNEVHTKIKELIGSWQPTFNNLKSLYLKNDGEWKKTPIPDAKKLQTEEAWEGMPQIAIDYIKSLPEFDAEIFKEITGIKNG